MDAAFAIARKTGAENIHAEGIPKAARLHTARYDSFAPVEEWKGAVYEMANGCLPTYFLCKIYFPS